MYGPLERENSAAVPTPFEVVIIFPKAPVSGTSVCCSITEEDGMEVCA